MRNKMIINTPPSDHSLPRWKVWLTWLLRLIVGGVFIFSGFTKAIDPWGTLYKMQDYVGAMGLDMFGPEILLTGAFILFALEFMTGVFLVTGTFRRFAPVMTCLFMLVMLPLTGWIALTDPVPDCGCFGDALLISNTATFWKNVFLTAGAVWIIIYNRRVHWLITPALQWIEFVVSGLFIIGVGVVGYTIQPLIDYRDYPTGGPLVSPDEGNAESHFVFTYEKDGVKKDFNETDSLPDEADGWKYIGRREQQVAQKTVAPADRRDLRIWSEDGEEDVTADVIGTSERQMVLMIPSMKDVSIAATWRINVLCDWAESHGVEFFAVVSGTPEQIAEWRDVSLSDYPIYTAEDTSIKEAVRGNPAVIYLQNGKIRWKSTLGSVRGDDWMAQHPDATADDLFVNVSTTAKDVLVLWLSVMGALVMFSFLPKMILGRRAAKRKLDSIPKEPEKPYTPE